MKYPVGIQSFEEIRNGGWVYADKTGIIHRLVQNGKYYFFSRPRRFGKSLTISTLQAYFEGRKELFEGLKIAMLEKEWMKYPVLHLDLNARNYVNLDSLKAELTKHLELWEKLYGDEYHEKAPEERFYQIIRKGFEKTGKQVVILVDEYDKPLLQTIGNEKLQDEIRAELKAFYSVLKTQDRYIRFAFLTGVTKFSKVSVFSDLNNLQDISLDTNYECLCGISKEELNEYFTKSIQEIAVANHYTQKEANDLLKKKYDGYHFSKNLTDIYNPFSLLNAFSKNDFGSYWFESGTPTFLVNLIRNNDLSLSELEETEMNAIELGNVDVMFTNPTPILYQSGYLTIKSYDPEFMMYKLGYPNEEVKEGFMQFLLPFYANVNRTEVAFNVMSLIKDIRKGDIDSFMLRLQSFFAGYNYELIPRYDLERHYQNVIFTVCRLVGLRVDTEYHTSNGRIDMLLQTQDTLYIFEFKLNVNSTRAIQQIQTKNYTSMFASDHRTKVKIGVNFNSDIRGIEDWTVKV